MVVAHRTDPDGVAGLQEASQGFSAVADAALGPHKGNGSREADQTCLKAFCDAVSDGCLARAAARAREQSRPTRCERWPDDLALESTLGQLVRGRCKAPNLCDYCAMLAGIENCYLLRRDAILNSAPTLWSVLGTRTATLDMAIFRNAKKMVLEAARKRWPAAQAGILTEYTTGYGTHSGGERRPHFNFTWKGVPVEDAEELHAVTLAPWLRNVDARADAHEFARCVREIGDMHGLGRYLADHLAKESQRPPTGFRGHRFRTTAGYLGMRLPEARAEARAEMLLDRERWKAEQRGLVGEAIEDAAQLAAYEKAELAWQLVRLTQFPIAWSDDGLPAAWEQRPVPVRG